MSHSTASQTANALLSCTGASRVTVTEERRNSDGRLTVTAQATATRSATPFARRDCFPRHCSPEEGACPRHATPEPEEQDGPDHDDTCAEELRHTGRCRHSADQD